MFCSALAMLGRAAQRIGMELHCKGKAKRSNGIAQNSFSRQRHSTEILREGIALQ